MTEGPILFTALPSIRLVWETLVLSYACFRSVIYPTTSSVCLLESIEQIPKQVLKTGKNETRATVKEMYSVQDVAGKNKSKTPTFECSKDTSPRAHHVQSINVSASSKYTPESASGATLSLVGIKTYPAEGASGAIHFEIMNSAGN